MLFSLVTVQVYRKNIEGRALLLGDEVDTIVFCARKEREHVWCLIGVRQIGEARTIHFDFE